MAKLVGGVYLGCKKELSQSQNFHGMRVVKQHSMTLELYQSVHGLEPDNSHSDPTHRPLTHGMCTHIEISNYMNI